MAELKIKIPEDLKRRMEKLGIDWSPAIRKMIEKEIQNLMEIERIVSKSKMTEEDALELGRRVSKSIAEKFREHVTLVTDANVVFATLIARGGTLRIFVVNRILGKFRFVAPEYLFIEIHEHFDEILEKTKLSREEVEVVLNFIKEQIELIPFEEFEDKYDDVESISPGPDDIPYFALALKLNCAIWSNDRRLKGQDAVRVYTTREIIQILEA